MPTESFRNSLYENLLKNNDTITQTIIGKSHLNKNINIFKIGNKRKIVLLAGAFHGSEWLTSLILIKFLFDLNNIIMNTNVNKKFFNTGISIIPVINPDGVEIALNGTSLSNIDRKYKNFIQKLSNNNTKKWQANALGVDINHNFNADWENLRQLEIKSNILGPAMTRYGGVCAESEPETKAIANFCRNHEVIFAIAFHSQGEEIYYNYNNIIPENSEKIANLLSEATGYNLSQPEGLAVGGGFKDWFILEFNRPAFTIEIGLGENPLPLEDFYKIYPKMRKILLTIINYL
ncbi:MAG: zinc carboxypeptidase [Candidatus Improbicoccus devescovinae]|nr:MAG: zinc carboxypeptidase [Candidatus Improbicoccus devescovinae]